MKLTVKNLKGEKFTVEAEGSATVGQVKTIIVSCLSYFLRKNDTKNMSLSIDIGTESLLF